MVISANFALLPAQDDSAVLCYLEKKDKVLVLESKIIQQGTDTPEENCKTENKLMDLWQRLKWLKNI